ncbi:MAG: NUDIX domain-containing protein [Bacteroidia bacterium]|nr:NUDIX domain-containing protein [Bacteroidia bacterium]
MQHISTLRDTKSSEMLPVVDPNGTVIGQASRAWCHSGQKLLHPVVHLHIINRMGDIYLQKRSAEKELLPNRWDTAVGGHISYGESITEALFREAEEELKFYDFNPIHLFSYVFESDIERELINVFAAVGNFTLHPDLFEVADGKYWSVQEIENSIGKDILTPNFEKEFQMVRQPLEALL